MMGYSVDSTETDIHIPSEKLGFALDALRPLLERDELDLGAALEELGWSAEVDEEQGLIDLVLACGRYDERERRVLHALAPFVEGKAVLKFIGDDHAQWAVVIEQNPETGENEMREEDVVLMLASEVDELDIARFVCGI